MFVKFVFISARSKLSSPLLSLPPLSPMQVWKVGGFERREFFISDVIGTWGR